jgi:hypothetical protein
MRPRARTLAAVSLCLAGCYQNTSLDDPDAFVLGADASLDAPLPPPDGPARDVPDPLDAHEPSDAPRPASDNVDLLLVVDSSNSMVEEQASLVAELPRIVRILATGDRDGDGVADFEPVRSLHVGVVTPDLGGGPNTGVPTCAAGLGDDGILRSRRGLEDPSCAATFPSNVFAFDPSGDDPAAFAAEVACVARVGSGGCGFEQQLEAMLKAVTPETAEPWARDGYVPPRFLSADGVRDATAGQGSGPNAGFLRPDSILAIEVLTDEDDCSLTDYGLMRFDDPRFSSVPLNLRCDAFGEPAMGVLYAYDRYVEGLLGLRREPRDVVFAVVAGIPPDLTPAPFAPLDVDGYGRILVDPRMRPTPDPMGTSLVPSCTSASGSAMPPVRLLQVARGLALGGARVGLGSICASDYGLVVDGIVLRLADLG